MSEHIHESLGLPEPNTRGLLFTLLEILGININDPETFIWEYVGKDADTSKKGIVDFCVIFKNGRKVAIELKAYHNDLKDKHVKQINDYLDKMKDINHIILTNGRLFNLYTRDSNNEKFELCPMLSIDMDNKELAEIYLSNLKAIFDNMFSLTSIITAVRSLSRSTEHDESIVSTEVTLCKNHIIQYPIKFYEIMKRHQEQINHYNDMTKSERKKYNEDEEFLNNCLILTPKSIIDTMISPFKFKSTDKIRINVKTLADGRNFIRTITESDCIINKENIVITCACRIPEMTERRDENVYYLDNEKTIKEVEDMKFDYIIQNPPYSGGKGRGDLHLDYFEWAYNLQKKNKGKMVIIEPNTIYGDLRKEDGSARNASRARKIRRMLDSDISVNRIIVENYNYDFQTNLQYDHSITFVDFTKMNNTVESKYLGYNRVISSISNESNPYGDLSLIDGIFNKIDATFKDKMSDHIVGKRTVFPKGTCFMKYAQLIGASGGGFAGSYGGSLQKAPALSDTGKFDSIYGTFVTGYLAPSCHPTSNAIDSNMIYSNNANDGSKGDKKIDNIYGTRKELENWVENCKNNALILYINMMYTFDQNNHTKNLLPWLVKKVYSSDEVFDMCKFTKEERIHIMKVVFMHRRDQAFFRRFLLGTNIELINRLRQIDIREDGKGIPENIKSTINMVTDEDVTSYIKQCEQEAKEYVEGRR